jgi:hypothetical protein
MSPAFTLTLLLALPALAQRPAAAEADAILERGREKALAYAKSLPDFVCTAIIQRNKLTQTPSVSLERGLPSPVSGALSWVPVLDADR